MAGPLILAGGAEFDERMAAADRAWLGPKAEGARVGVFPTANLGRPDVAAVNGVTHFRSIGAHSQPVMVTTRRTAEDKVVLDQLRGLDFAYFAGGEPLHLAGTLAGSKVWDALLERWRGGMGLGGSSAGAMVLCEAIFVQDRWAQGMGVVPGIVLRPHFNRHDQSAIERQREQIVSRGLIGVGIDESTALVWRAGSGWQVAGPGSVWVLTAEGAAHYSDGSRPPGVPSPMEAAP